MWIEHCDLPVRAHISCAFVFLSLPLIVVASGTTGSSAGPDRDVPSLSQGTTQTAAPRDSVTVTGVFPPLVDSVGGQLTGVPFGKDAVRLRPGVQRPSVVKEVVPSYTVDGLRRKIQGTVKAEVVVTPDGRVVDVRILQSVDGPSGLDAKAIDAARRWEFQPPTDADGKPISVIVPVELEFRLHGRARDALPPATTNLPQRLAGIPPAYPPAALAARVAGVVGIDATIDGRGNIINQVIFESVPMLDAAALAAVSKWRYAPTTVNGALVEVPITIYITFQAQ